MRLTYMFTMWIVQDIFIIILLSWFARFCFFYHKKYFDALFHSRKYAFYDFHAWREIPLALIIQLSIITILVSRTYVIWNDFCNKIDRALYNNCEE